MNLARASGGVAGSPRLSIYGSAKDYGSAKELNAAPFSPHA